MSKPEDGDILYIVGSQRYGVLVGRRQINNGINPTGRSYDYDGVVELNSEGDVISTPLDEFNSAGDVSTQCFHLEEKFRLSWINLAASQVTSGIYRGMKSKDFVDEIIRQSRIYADSRWLS